MGIFNHLNALFTNFKREVRTTINNTLDSLFGSNLNNYTSTSIFNNNERERDIAPNVDKLEISYTKLPTTSVIDIPILNEVGKDIAKKIKETTEITQEIAKNKITDLARPVVKLVRNAIETLSYLKSIGYDEKAGKKLAQTALRNTHGRRKSTHKCAKGVKTAILNSNLGRYQSGHAYDIPKILASNPNFKEVPVSSVDWRNLPGGCVKWYAPGSAGYSKDYGHVSITGENPKEEYSDFIARVNPNRKPDKIYIPVTSA